ncbi:hypothetical protein TEA_025262 [Camellia sinensis var. sinensis]|uniref:peroxidase n=1 Tax=Camellia sinensis var. sinensis TaxID=542762 RepID=A0A4S4EX24_CAMSN|nr:hypothetical protein TEA_025262 [Camellia sinensis var. sinensis]
MSALVLYMSVCLHQYGSGWGDVAASIAVIDTYNLEKGSARADLKMGFYDKSCPKAEKIVLDFVKEHIPNAPSLAAALIRMHFHDCFVRGCDGSILLNFTTASGNQTEKVAPPNLSVRGFSFIDRVKSLLEAECPGIVSCADIITLVTRDSIVVTGGPTWRVPTGRRDGTVSNATEALNNIPAPTSNISTLQTKFAAKGLNLKDLVLLSGAHTIGVAHCSSFSNRLYNFTGVGDQDPALDSEYAANLKARKCKTSTDNTTLVEMDPGSFRTFDLDYYTLVLKRRGLFQSDSALRTSSTTKTYITQLLSGSLQNFYSEFALSMEKMGRVGVKTGSAGQIRKHCAVRRGVGFDRRGSDLRRGCASISQIGLRAIAILKFISERFRFEVLSLDFEASPRGREETEIEANVAIFRISPPGLYSVGANHHRREKAWWKEEEIVYVNVGNGEHMHFWEDAGRGEDYFVHCSLVCIACLCLIREANELAFLLSILDEISVDSEKGILTVIGNVDPVLVATQVRKSRKVADLIGVGPSKTKEKRLDPPKSEPAKFLDSKVSSEHDEIQSHLAIVLRK